MYDFISKVVLCTQAFNLQYYGNYRADHHSHLSSGVHFVSVCCLINFFKYVIYLFLLFCISPTSSFGYSHFYYVGLHNMIVLLFVDRHGEAASHHRGCHWCFTEEMLWYMRLHGSPYSLHNLLRVAPFWNGKDYWYFGDSCCLLLLGLNMKHQ
jgi:hypothetical protein